MAKTSDDDVGRRLKRHFGNSWLSQQLYFFQLPFLIGGIFLFSVGRWVLGSQSIFIAILIAIISYRFAGGRKNPVIWEGQELFIILQNAVDSGNARVGFHSSRDQALLLNKLSMVDIEKKSFQNTRQFITDKILNDRKAFNALQGNICIEMAHKGKSCFWDGYGKRKDGQHFHEAEILFDIKSSADYMFTEVLEGLGEN